MKKLAYVFIASFVAAGCASKKVETSKARENLEDKYKGLIGSATKADMVQDFGNPEWCRPEASGAETCRFYKKLGTKWIGDKLDKKSVDMYDDVVADFDANGKLTDFKAKSQR